MNIRPKNTILFALTGVKFSLNNLRGANWRQQVFNNYRLHLLDLLAKYGEADDYGSWLNEMLSRHSKIYNLAGGENGNWEDTAYKNDLVGLYQQDYRGGLGNDNLYKRYGSVLLNDDDKYDFNQTGIKTNQSTRYNIANPPSRTSGDYSRDGYNYKIDNLYSAITDDRRLLGRKGDWDENSEEFKSWQKDLNSKGWETYLDTNDNYYKLRRLSLQTAPLPILLEQKSFGINPTEKRDNTNDFWNKLSTGFKNIAPDLLEGIRLAGTLYNNERIFDESKKAIIPNLLLSYHTHRQVVGDEATKQAYYRRAVLGLTRAAQPFTSDADRLMAYLFELKRIGDELRALGDLADNLRIRETSAESSAHADANRERDTAVANSNLTELIKARAARHLLLALKYLADWTNIDLALLGLLAKLYLKKSRQEAIEDLIKSIQMQEALLNDTTLTTLKDLYDKIWSDPKATTAQKMEAARKYRQAQLEKLKLLLITYGKLGTKITHKDSTPKFLYKTSKDIVEHFRRMSKMTDDSRIKTMPKPIKLSSHPKTKKMLMGGIAPFYVYRPFMGGGETTTLTETGNSKSSKNTAAKDKIDMLKELFKQVEGLPIDVTAVYLSMKNTLDKARLLGEELSSDDIAAMYLSSMNDLAKLKYSLKAYNDARSVAAANDALGELAVGANGEMILLDKEGNIKIGSYIDWKESEGKLNPLTNELLLTIRAHSPNLAFNDKMFDIVANGVGMTKIASHIKSIAGTIGSMELKLEGISEVESRKIKSGLLILAGTSGTPDGFYLVSTDKKDSSAKVNAALNYIYNMLPNNYKTILEMHSGGKGKELIGSMLTSLTEDYIKLDITPLTGKAVSSKNGSSSGENDMLPSVAFFNGMGEKDLFIILDKTSDGLKVNVISTPITSKGYNTGSITFDKLESSDFGGQLLMNLATMGDSLISSTGRNNIIIDSRIYQTELPIDAEAKRNGIIKPDLRFLKRIEAADSKLRQMGIDKSDPKNISTVNKIYLENNLPILYTISNNKPTITSEYARFAIVNGVGTEDAFGDNPEFNDAIKEISSDKERELFETMMRLQGNTKYKLDNGIGIFGYSVGETKLYKGTIYIPMATSNLSALAGTGYKAKGEEYNEIEAKQQAADAARNKGFVPAGDASNFK